MDIHALEYFLPRLSERQRLAELILTLKTRLARPSPQPLIITRTHDCIFSFLRTHVDDNNLSDTCT